MYFLGTAYFGEIQITSEIEIISKTKSEISIEPSVCLCASPVRCLVSVGFQPVPLALKVNQTLPIFIYECVSHKLYLYWTTHKRLPCES